MLSNGWTASAVAAANSPPKHGEVKEAENILMVPNGLPLPERMQVAHQAFQALFQHMGIDLGRRNVGVAEQGLHDTQIGAIVQKVAGEGVAQHVRA